MRRRDDQEHHEHEELFGEYPALLTELEVEPRPPEPEAAAEETEEPLPEETNGKRRRFRLRRRRRHAEPDVEAAEPPGPEPAPEEPVDEASELRQPKWRRRKHAGRRPRTDATAPADLEAPEEPLAAEEPSPVEPSDAQGSPEGSRRKGRLRWRRRRDELGDLGDAEEQPPASAASAEAEPAEEPMPAATADEADTPGESQPEPLSMAEPEQEAVSGPGGGRWGRRARERRMGERIRAVLESAEEVSAPQPAAQLLAPERHATAEEPAAQETIEEIIEQLNQRAERLRRRWGMRPPRVAATEDDLTEEPVTEEPEIEELGADVLEQEKRERRPRRRWWRRRPAVPEESVEPQVEEPSLEELALADIAAGGLVPPEAPPQVMPQAPTVEPEAEEEEEPEEEVVERPKRERRRHRTPGRRRGARRTSVRSRVRLARWLGLLLVAAAAGSVAPQVLPRGSDDDSSGASGSIPVPPEQHVVAWVVHGIEDETFLTVLASGERRPLALAIPSNLTITVPGQSLGTLEEAADTSDEGLVAVALQNTLGVPIDAAVTTDVGTFSAMIDAVGGVEVADQVLNGAAALSYLHPMQAIPLPDEPFLRWQDVLESLMDAVAAKPETAATFHPEIGAAMSAALPEPPDMIALPVIDFGAGVLRVDREALKDLIKRRFLVQGGGDVVRVVVLNGVGTPGIGEDVAKILVPEGFLLVSSQNANTFDLEETRIIASSEADVPSAERARQLLGVGRVYLGNQPGLADVTVVVGRDFGGS